MMEEKKILTEQELKKAFEEQLNSWKIKYPDIKPVIIEPEDLTKLRDIAQKRANYKKEHNERVGDQGRAIEREISGLLGERCCELFFGLKNIIDTSLGNSKDYNVPDLEKEGYNIGVKCSESPNFPVIKKYNKYPQIICLKNIDEIKDDSGKLVDKKISVTILGLALPDVLNSNDNRSDDYIKSKNMTKYKTAFYRFDRLQKLESLEDLEPYKIKKL